MKREAAARAWVNEGSGLPEYGEGRIIRQERNVNEDAGITMRTRSGVMKLWNRECFVRHAVMLQQ
jgi:hypothetical protein